eukprot:1159175-Pelagomonas_calceolata.AAC.11
MDVCVHQGVCEEEGQKKLAGCSLLMCCSSRRQKPVQKACLVLQLSFGGCIQGGGHHYVGLPKAMSQKCMDDPGPRFVRAMRILFSVQSTRHHYAALPAAPLYAAASAVFFTAAAAAVCCLGSKLGPCLHELDLLMLHPALVQDLRSSYHRRSSCGGGCCAGVVPREGGLLGGAPDHSYLSLSKKKITQLRKTMHPKKKYIFSLRAVTAQGKNIIYARGVPVKREQPNFEMQARRRHTKNKPALKDCALRAPAGSEKFEAVEATVTLLWAAYWKFIISVDTSRTAQALCVFTSTTANETLDLVRTRALVKVC